VAKARNNPSRDGYNRRDQRRPTTENLIEIDNGKENNNFDEIEIFNLDLSHAKDWMPTKYASLKNLINLVL
jgi:hypothetical protein